MSLNELIHLKSELQILKMAWNNNNKDSNNNNSDSNNNNQLLLFRHVAASRI